MASSSQDGFISVQDTAAKWSGIFLEVTDETKALNRGDVINLTAGEVAEVQVNDFGVSNAPVTQLINTAFTVTSTGADIDDVVPVLFTDDVTALQAQGEIEAYEGMLLKFENAKVVSVDAFGEFQIANLKDGQAEYSTSGVILNEDMRLPGIGETDFPGDANTAAKDSVVFDAVYGVMSTAFGNGVVLPRGLDDLIADNWANPTEFDLISPEDSSTVEVTNDVAVSWEESNDYDGTDVVYLWSLFNASDTTLVAAVEADNEGLDAGVTLDYATVDGLLAGAGLQNGQSADFVWNVQASSGEDTLTTEFYFLTLIKGMLVSNEGEAENPVRFSLEQNYPNPFNPTTSIRFSLAKASNVTLNVYNMLGQKVSTLVNERMSSGAHTVSFDANNLASGMYIYRIEAGDFTSVKKMMLIK